MTENVKNSESLSTEPLSAKVSESNSQILAMPPMTVTLPLSSELTANAVNSTNSTENVVTAPRTWQYAPFWRRAVAGGLDFLWIEAIILAIAGALIWFGLDAVFPRSIHFGLNVVLPSLIILNFWQSYSAATPAKLLFDCKVVDATTGQPVHSVQGVLRLIGYAINIMSGGLGFLWALFDARSQGWHDKIAHTVVIMHDDADCSIEELEKQCF